MRSAQVGYLEFQRRWGGLPVHWRWSIAVLLGLALVTCGLGGWQHRRESPTHEWLFSGQSFSIRDLAQMDIAFAAAQLNDYDIEGGRVRIPRDKRSEYVGAITKSDALPLHLNTQQPSDFAQASPFETNRQQEERRRIAQQQELATGIRSMKGIDDATVQIDEAVTGTGLRKQQQVTAVVIVWPSKNMPLRPQRIRSIQQLIAGAKVQLRLEDVTVTDTAAGRTYCGDVAEWEGWAEYAQERLDWERQWSERLRRVLHFIPGVEVTATVEAPGPVAPGSAAPDSAAPDSAAPDSIVQKATSPPSTEPLVPAHPTDPPPTSISVSIGVPNSYYRQVWEERHPSTETRPDPPDAAAIRSIEQETHDRVQQVVAQLLPIESDRAIAPRVSVFSYADVVPPPHVRSHDVRPGLSVRPVPLLVIALAFGSFALYGIWRDARPRKPQPPPELRVVRNEREPAATAVSRAPHAAGKPVASTPAARGESTTTIHEELTHIVRENPQAAAEMLRNWVDQAG